MLNDINRSIEALKRRETELGKPHQAHQLKTLEKFLGRNIGQDFNRLFSVVDGFIDYDHLSQIIIWNLDTILKRNFIINDAITKDGWVAIGDFLIESDLIVAQISQEKAPVKLWYSNDMMADSICEFFEKISLGGFDFI